MISKSSAQHGSEYRVSTHGKIGGGQIGKGLVEKIV